MGPPAEVVGLVERFEEQREDYRSGRYKEARLRSDFLDPFFVALGWDVRNREGRPEAWREVMPEYTVRVRGATQMVDYCFRIGREPIFFVEAKKPAVDIRQERGPAFQLRTYGWNLKLDVSILTDFEEFAVYDCRTAPAKTDRASTARLIYWKYTEYADHWDELVNLFSPEGIRRGRLDKFMSSKRPRKGTEAVDGRFLREIESWRELLARNVALRNEGLLQGEVNFAVQRTIDRMIFLRICEDRGIELYGRLQGLANGPNVYRRLRQLFQEADDRYNSGLFYFTAENGRGDPDRLTLELTIDDKALNSIVKGLYEGPYNFAVMPVEILGQVYEQFLGKVIRLTKGHHAKVEEKPEVKKAGGVYYTPKYIVDYIVKNTVGKLLKGNGGGGKGMTPKQAAKLRILDPACGSGSFLLGAYQYLLDWHLERHVGHGVERRARGKEPVVFRDRHGRWRLTAAEKKRILLNNIYGVDIDPQAVEVTKLSLLLKVLEEESQKSLETQLRFAHERALPDLGSNIKCGNSLIGPDFYDDKQMSLLDEEEQYRINVFNWQGEFPEAFQGKNPGFDAVIGNPPWLMAGYYVGSELEHLRRRYDSAEGKFDLYYVFVELGLHLISELGLFGMIVPNKFFHTRAARNLRCQLSEGRMVRALVDFGYERVFQGATNYSCILLAGKTATKEIHFSRAVAGLSILESYEVPCADFGAEAWHFVRPQVKSLFDKMESVSVRLSTLTKRFGTGMQTGSDRVLSFELEAARELELEEGALRSMLRGRDVRRYCVAPNPKMVLFPYWERGEEFVIYSESELRSKFPNVYSYLSERKRELSNRVWFGKNARQLSGEWYGMMYLDAGWAFALPHLLTPSLSDSSNFAVGGGTLFATGTAGVTSVIPREDDQESLLYLLGLLNSRALSFYAIRHSPVFQGGYYKFSAPYLKELPIREISASARSDTARKERIVQSVERMLALHERLAFAKTAHDKTVVQRQIEATDRQIDRLVYELYGLTDEEIAIVEGDSEENE